MNKTIFISLVTLSFLTNTYANDTKTSVEILKDALVEMKKVAGDIAVSKAVEENAESNATEAVEENVESNTTEAVEENVESNATEAVEENAESNATEKVEATPETNSTEDVKEKVHK